MRSERESERDAAPGQWDARTVLIVAHRAGNDPGSARRARGRADVIELDVHVLRGRIEVRHAKVLRPTSRLWERWYLLPKGARGIAIDEILGAVDPDTHLMLDLKCFTSRAARRIGDAVPASHPLTVSSRSWWVLRAFRGRRRTKRMRSCGNRTQLALVRIIPGLGQRVGAVVHERLLDEQTIRALRAKTPHLGSWAAATPQRARQLVDAGVTALIVDDLDLDWPRQTPIG